MRDKLLQGLRLIESGHYHGLGDKWLKATGGAAAIEIEKLVTALREARSAWQEQLDADLHSSCSLRRDGSPNLDEMDEEQRPMIEETRELIARLDLALNIQQRQEPK